MRNFILVTRFHSLNRDFSLNRDSPNRHSTVFAITVIIVCFQGDCQRDKEAVGRGERGLRVHSWNIRQTSPRATKERIRQVLKEILKHLERLLQRGRVSFLCVGKPCLNTFHSYTLLYSGLRLISTLMTYVVVCIFWGRFLVLNSRVSI